jgi:hypothetical protein
LAQEQPKNQYEDELRASDRRRIEAEAERDALKDEKKRLQANIYDLRKRVGIESKPKEPEAPPDLPKPEGLKESPVPPAPAGPAKVETIHPELAKPVQHITSFELGYCPDCDDDQKAKNLNHKREVDCVDCGGDLNTLDFAKKAKRCPHCGSHGGYVFHKEPVSSR